MTGRDDLLRAAVYDYYDVRDRGGDDQACRRAAERVVNVHRLWPLIEHQQAMIAVEDDLARRGDEHDQWVVETAERLCRRAA